MFFLNGKYYDLHSIVGGIVGLSRGKRHSFCAGSVLSPFLHDGINLHLGSHRCSSEHKTFSKLSVFIDLCEHSLFFSPVEMELVQRCAMQ